VDSLSYLNDVLVLGRLVDPASIDRGGLISLASLAAKLRRQILRTNQLNLFDSCLDLFMGGAMDSQMAALSRAFPVSILESDMLKQLLLLGCAGLFLSVVMMTYGVDLSPGFF
jgi:hypothetical protein